MPLKSFNLTRDKGNPRQCRYYRCNRLSLPFRHITTTLKHRHTWDQSVSWENIFKVISSFFRTKKKVKEGYIVCSINHCQRVHEIFPALLMRDNKRHSFWIPKINRSCALFLIVPVLFCDLRGQKTWNIANINSISDAINRCELGFEQHCSGGNASYYFPVQ